MLDKKRRLFRLRETHINDCNLKIVDGCYGEGAKIKIHNMQEVFSEKSLLFEVIIILGDIIDESVLNEEPAQILVRDAINLFFPEYNLRTIIRWDV